MFRINFLLILSLLFINLSCKKDNDELAKDLTEIKVGEYENIVVKYYDTTLIGGYHSPKTFKLDIDNDGSYDIMFTSELWGSPGVGMHPRSMITCMNEQTKLYGFNTSDTSYLNQDFKIFNGSNNTVEVYEYYNYTCYRIDKLDSILKITPSAKVLPLNKFDVLKQSDIFNSDAFILLDDKYHYPTFKTGENGDTLFYETTTYFNDCNSFPLAEVKYIGISLSNKSKLGWVKFSIFDKYKILILESGVQE